MLKNNDFFKNLTSCYVTATQLHYMHEIVKSMDLCNKYDEIL